MAKITTTKTATPVAKMSAADKAKLAGKLSAKLKAAAEKPAKGTTVSDKATKPVKGAKAAPPAVKRVKGDGRLRDKTRIGKDGMGVVVKNDDVKPVKWWGENAGEYDCFGNKQGTRAHEFNRIALAAHRKGEEFRASDGTAAGLAACGGCIDKLKGGKNDWEKLIESGPGGGYVFTALAKSKLKANGGGLFPKGK